MSVSTSRQAPQARARSPGAAESVFTGILSALERQAMVPAQRLVEADLALQFGVGRNSVREALARLEAEGIVEITRNKGAVIRRLTLQQTLDVLEVAQAMTALLARSAARGAARRGATVPLGEAIRELRDAEARADPDAFAAARRHFYRSLLELSGNDELRRLFPTIQMPVVHAQHRVAGLQKIRLEDYQRIARAVKARDEDAAAEAGALHVRHVREAIAGLG